MNGSLKIIIQFVYVRLYYSPKTDYCLPLSRMARMGMDYNLKKLANFSSSHSELIEFLAQNLAVKSFRKNLSLIFFSCSKKYITHK